MKLNNNNIFIFILIYDEKNFKDISFLKIFYSLLKEDYNKIWFYYSNLLKLKRWKKHIFILLFLIIFYFFLFLTSNLLKFLFLKFIFYSIKYIVKYIFFFLDFSFFYISNKFFNIFFKKFLGFFYVIFIKSLFKIYKLIFYHLPLFIYLSYWSELLISFQKILIILGHRILDIIESIPNTRLIKFIKYVYYINWNSRFKDSYRFSMNFYYAKKYNWNLYFSYIYYNYIDINLYILKKNIFFRYLYYLNVFMPQYIFKYKLYFQLNKNKYTLAIYDKNYTYKKCIFYIYYNLLYLINKILKYIYILIQFFLHIIKNIKIFIYLFI